MVQFWASAGSLSPLARFYFNSTMVQFWGSDYFPERDNS